MGSATQWMKALGFSASSTGVAFTKKHNFVKIQKFIFIFSSEATQKITNFHPFVRFKEKRDFLSP